MKRIPVSGTGLSVEEENNEVRISNDSFHARRSTWYISVPHSHSSTCVQERRRPRGHWRGREWDVNEVNAPSLMNKVSGSAVEHALNGRLLATFRA